MLSRFRYVLLIPALLYLTYAAQRGEGAFFHTDTQSHVLLIVSGLVTTAPLLLFASAAQRIPLTTMGILQYIAPTIQFILGAVVYQEPFSEDQLIGFGLVWSALIIFAAGGMLTRKTRKAAI